MKVTKGSRKEKVQNRLADLVTEPSGNGHEEAAPEVAKPRRGAKVTAGTVVIPQLQLQPITIRLVGDTPLIVHRWSEKARSMMLAKQTKQAQHKKGAKDPFADFIGSLYTLNMPEGGLDPSDYTPETINTSGLVFGFPAGAIKRAAVSACSYAEGLTKVGARGAFHVRGEQGTDLVVVHGQVNMREDMVRIGMGVADIRYRGEFRQWYIDVPIVLNKRAISADQLVNLLSIAGFGVGIGEHRPECDGSFGCFRVEGTK